MHYLISVKLPWIYSLGYVSNTSQNKSNYKKDLITLKSASRGNAQ